MPTRRMERINSLLLEEISKYVVRKQNPDVGFVTFTDVKVTDDFMQARVFYSVLGDEAQRETTAQALAAMTWEIRQDLRRLENLRIIPSLEWVFDETPSRAARVFELLQDINRENEPPADEPKAKPKRRKKTE